MANIYISQCFLDVLKRPHLEEVFKEMVYNNWVSQDASELLAKYAHALGSFDDFRVFVTFLRVLKSDVTLKESRPNIDFFNLTPVAPLNQFNVIIDRLVGNTSRPPYVRTTDVQCLLDNTRSKRMHDFTRSPKHKLIANAADVDSNRVLADDLRGELLKYKTFSLAVLELSQLRASGVFAKLKYTTN